MKIFAQVLNSVLHCKFEQEEPPQFSDDIKIIEITNLLPMPSEGWAWDGKTFISPAPATIVELKTAKKDEITQAFNASMSQIVGDTPDYEISSWGKQEDEARSFADTATTKNPTPLIDNLAAARGISKELLASKIIQKADLYSSYSGRTIGKRQRLEAEIDAATSKTALATIVW